MVASDAVVTSGRTSFLTSSQTSTPVPAKSTLLTVPFSMPAMRTGEPLLMPATLGKVVFSGYCCQKKPPPPTAKISTAGQERGADGEDAELEFGEGE